MLGRFVAAVMALMPAAAFGQTPPLSLLVPAYFYPGAGVGDWDRLAAAAADVAVTAIVNPASGPGDSADPNYTRALAAFRRAGGRVLGYVPSGYGGVRVQPASSCRPSVGRRYSVEDLVACARRYSAFYAIDGIFVDEMGTAPEGAGEAAAVAFYTQLYDGLKAIDGGWRVFGNPGVVASGRLRRRGAVGGADVLVTFEDTAAHLVEGRIAPEKGRRRADQTGALVIETPTGFDFAALIAALADRSTTYVYATDGRLPNPYDRLPAAWEQQVQALKTFNARRGR